MENPGFFPNLKPIQFDGVRSVSAVSAKTPTLFTLSIAGKPNSEESLLDAARLAPQKAMERGPVYAKLRGQSLVNKG